jgi:transglutaminase-like putative cysteine protease
VVSVLTLGFVVVHALASREPDSGALSKGMLDAAVHRSLKRYPKREAEWTALLKSVPANEKLGAEYLVAFMPMKDLRVLSTDKVRAALDLSYAAKKKVAWGQQLPPDVFMDAVLPYASVTEKRDSMRAEFQKRYLSLVAKAKTPGEAAILVNSHLFKDYKVVYNTRRRHTDQTPAETIEQGMATCTGLSIMLVDALRAVCVPARVAGINSWPGRGGNHTWVEVWDKGAWHFTGAAEQDPAGLDRGWFADEAGRAIADKPLNAIWAVSYRPTGQFFPMSWAPNTQVNGVNVTPRYNKRLADLSPRLMVEVKQGGERVIADVIAYNAATGDQCLIGKSKGPNADVNLHLSTPVTGGGEFLVTAKYQDHPAVALAHVTGDTVVHLDLDRGTPESLKPVFADYFSADTKPEAGKAATKLLSDLPYSPALAKVAWEAFKEKSDPELRKQFDANTVSTSDRTSPYLWRKVGEKPATGGGLVIAMHGGGGVPKGENDGEWHYMFDHYYKDHPEAGGYIYLALRAPNDNWNGFYDDAISPMVERLIWQFVKYAEVDPDRVYACGASHGGYGSFVIGPKVPYRFAAVHPAAAAPSPGETELVNLRNLRFTWAVGQNDHDYGRVERARETAVAWADLKKKYGGFDGGLDVVAGHGHLINDFEADKTAEFRKYARNALPKRVIWAQTDNVLHHFYWLEALSPAAKGSIDATVQGNTITLSTENQGDVALWLSPKLVDYQLPIIVIRDGKQSTFKAMPSMATYAAGLAAVADPELVAPVRVVVSP